MQPIPGSERISEDELEYHARLVESVRWAQQAQIRIAQIESSFRSWGEHLHEKYGLGEGDGVDEDGTITRPESPVVPESNSGR